MLIEESGKGRKKEGREKGRRMKGKNVRFGLVLTKEDQKLLLIDKHRIRNAPYNSLELEKWTTSVFIFGIDVASCVGKLNISLLFSFVWSKISYSHIY